MTTPSLTTVERNLNSSAETQSLVEFCDWCGASPQLDPLSGTLRGVKILGIRSQNGRVYLPAALADAVSLYEGAKVNVNHPKGHPRSPRDYQERIGSIRNVALKPGEGLFGDFHFNPRHALAEQLVWDAAHAPENVGFSHNVDARLSRRDDQVVVEAITRVHSVDLVADPATTGGLFEATAEESAKPGSVRQGLNSGALLQPPELVVEAHADAAQLASDNARLRVENTQLKAEADRLAETMALAQRRGRIVALLSEYQLPPPESMDRAARAITSDRFFEELLATPDDNTLRGLVEERAALVAGIRRDLTGDHNPPRRPVSRSPRDVDFASPQLDVASFVRAIRG